MRKAIDNQLTFGSIDISEIKFDPKSRDDIPQILKGLQYIYTQTKIRKQIFDVLEQMVAPNKDKKNGRPGMDLWKILVIGSLRLNLNMDYDRLHELVNNHKTIRAMLGHGFFDHDKTYDLQTLKDNVCLLTTEALNEINMIVVEAGHELVKKKEGGGLKARCDSFVIETNVHFPTDINLLFDSLRKVIQLTSKACLRHNLPGWRQKNHIIKKIKRQFRKIQKMKHSSSKNLVKKLEKEKHIKSEYKSYIKESILVLEKANRSKQDLIALGADPNNIEEIDYFMEHAEHQINLIQRRVIQVEIIPHEEKVFSVFEPHTEWISKGKAGVPVELGLRVAIVEDQFGFILHHKLLKKQTDDKIAVCLIKETKKLYPCLSSCSFDKGFHSPSNQIALKEILDVAALPKKGKLSKKDIEDQQSKQYKLAKNKHSAVESAINALQVHGLDRCPDKGLDALERYVSLGIMARNIQLLGTVLIKKEIRKNKRNLKKQKDLMSFLPELVA